jgi:hypothetical protein
MEFITFSCDDEESLRIFLRRDGVDITVRFITQSECKTRVYYDQYMRRNMLFSWPMGTQPTQQIPYDNNRQYVPYTSTPNQDPQSTSNGVNHRW